MINLPAVIAAAPFVARLPHPDTCTREDVLRAVKSVEWDQPRAIRVKSRDAVRPPEAAHLLLSPAAEEWLRFFRHHSGGLVLATITARHGLRHVVDRRLGGGIVVLGWHPIDLCVWRFQFEEGR